MSVVRRFLVAPSLVRLIRKERGGSRVTEGFFAPQAGRTSYVRVDGQQCHLVLVTTGADGASSEERTDVPRAHGDALLDVCTGKAIYDRTVVPVGGTREALVDRYTKPGGLDLVSLVFEQPDEAAAFEPPAWFGTEVSADAAYDRHAIALQGAPQPGEVALGNAALEAVLDMFEPRFGLGRFGAPERPVEDDAARKARRRAAAAAAAAASPEPAPAPPVPEPAPVQPEPVPMAEAPPAEPAPSLAAPEPAPEPAPDPAPAAKETRPTDARIDDVIESLSQALGASQQPRESSRDEDTAAEFERWTVRPRRTQQQT